MERPSVLDRTGLRLLQAFDALSRLAAASPDLGGLAGQAAVIVKDCLAVANVAVLAVDHARRCVELLAQASDLPVRAGPGWTQGFDVGLLGRAVREGRTVLVADVRGDPDYVPGVAGACGELVVPVLVDGQVAALLDCEIGDADALQDRVVLLELVAGRLGITLENARLLREREAALAQARERLRELQVLNEVSRIASGTDRLRPRLQRITDLLAERFGWEFVACVQVDVERGGFVCEAVTSAVPTEVVPGYGRPLGSGVVGEVAATGVALSIDDVSRHRNYVETLPGARSELCVPIAHGGVVIGVLNLESRRLAAFREQQELLRTVAEQLAGAMAGTRMYLDLRRHAGHLRLLGELSRDALAAGDPLEVPRRVVEAIQQRLQLSLVAALLLDESGRELELVAHAGELPLDVARGARWPADRGVVGRALRRGELELVEDVAADPDYVPLDPRVVSELVLPLRLTGRLLGAINVESVTREAFTPENVLLLRTLADQVAGAIHLATLGHRLGEANRALRESNRQLEEAQEQIHRLVASPPGAQGDLAGWCSALAADIGLAVGATAIGVWELREGALHPIAAAGLSTPDAELLQQTREGGLQVPGTDDVLLPVVGLGGETCGALRIAGSRLSWSEREQRLTTGLAHQVASALEMQRLRGQLATARAAQQARRTRLQQDGTVTLQVCPRCGACYDHADRVCARDGAALDDSWLLPRVLQGRYRLHRLLGRGGMGAVFEAGDQKLDRVVALKLIRPEHFHNPDLRARFEREARAVARIHHPGVAAVHDSGELEDGSLYIVMERLWGADLARVLQQHGPGRPSQVARLLRLGSAALAAAHRAGIVHRDIKPANVFLAPLPDGFAVKVLDFGLAKSGPHDVSLTQTGAVLGTPAYMAPEQVRGGSTDERTDLYAFAAVIYEALTGQRAVGGREVARVLVDVLDARVALPSALRPGLPAGIDRAVVAGLAKDPAERPGDLETWAQAIAEVLAAHVDDVPGWPADLEVRPAAGDDRPDATTFPRLD